MPSAPTQSEAEALALLEKHRKSMIHDGRWVAKSLAATRGEVTARDVLDYMEEHGMIPEDYTGRHNWVACVFKFRGSNKVWRKAGMRKTGCSARNVHAAYRTVWELINLGARCPRCGATKHAPGLGASDQAKRAWGLYKHGNGGVEGYVGVEYMGIDKRTGENLWICLDCGKTFLWDGGKE